jgi:ABC-type uncharacterized transport system permease subunit
MAVAWVLSLIVGPAGFVILCVAACILQVRRGLDEVVVTLFLAALGCPLICAVYREWFRRWGQKYWPNPVDPADETIQTP